MGLGRNGDLVARVLIIFYCHSFLRVVFDHEKSPLILLDFFDVDLVALAVLAVPAGPGASAACDRESEHSDH